ncbi:MAG: alkaline phosphatase family protein [Acidaminococcaceae bacterium]|nr:alkaline phosphatase family protein [Acidaminococcaceae bacterium]
MDKVMILVIDGCAPEYITAELAPHIHQLAGKYGFAKTVKAVVPTVTNVNHASILSGQFPSVTGMVGNYYYNPVTGEEGFIEEKGFMKAETLLQAYRCCGYKTAFLTVKGKLLGVYGHAADIGISVQTPERDLLERLGLPMPPAIDSLESSRWIVDAALACIRKEDPALVYCTTNDYEFHHYGPEAAEAQQQIRQIDEAVAAIYAADPERQIYITADHGMNQKHHLLDFQRLADAAGLHIFCLAPLKDRYKENHVYQEGGILYLFLKEPEEKAALMELIRSRREIEGVMDKKEAAEKMHLPLQGIGDYVIFTAPDCAFGELDGLTELTTDKSRTHGSLYEQKVPLLAIHPAAPAETYQYSKDIAAVLLQKME